MPPKSKTEREKQEITVADVGSLSEVLESPHEKEAKGLRKQLDELQQSYDLLKSNAEEFQSDLIRLSEESKNLKLLLLQTVEDRDDALDRLYKLKGQQEAGKNDKVIHLAGVPYKIWHQAPTKEFFEDIKKRIVPEESICLSVVKA